ncbi:MAG: thioredoxin-disulfide reductase [Candidatus Geothermincolia bacterium]
MKTDYDLVIVGGGPAGLTAGIYAVRAGLAVVLVEEKLPGGQPMGTEKIENFPGFPEGVGGQELMERFRLQAERLGLEMRTFDPVNAIEDAGGVKTVHTDEGDITALAVVVATGHAPAPLGVPGEDALLGRGVSYCATCDGAFYKDKTVIVVGGGNAAVEEAVFLTRFAVKVYVVHRRDRLRAARAEQDKAFAQPRIEFVWNAEVQEVLGDGKVSGARIKDVRTGEERVIAADGIFLYVGSAPSTGSVKGLVELDDRGYIVTGKDLQTSRSGIFAAGDVRSGSVKQVITASAEGALAAMRAQAYVEGLKGTAYE